MTPPSLAELADLAEATAIGVLVGTGFVVGMVLGLVCREHANDVIYRIVRTVTDYGTPRQSS